MDSAKTQPLNRRISFMILGSAVISIIIIFLFLRGVLSDWKSFLIGFFWAFSISFTQWAGLDLIYRIIDRRISWMESPVKKVFIQVFLFINYSGGAYILVQFTNYYLWKDISSQNSWALIFQSLPSTLLISFVISLIFTAIGFFNAWRQSFIRAEQLKVEMMAYKYESLRNQINPHFLFNSLNVLSDLVYDDQKLAVKFIRQMSDLFRYVLDSRDKELVPLLEEVNFMQSYIFLLKTRFEDKLQIEVDVKTSPDDYIVPMTLQLLVENAVKHNEVSEAFPLKVKIYKKGEFIEVENNLQLKKTGEDSKKTGLRNITQQFSFFSDKPITIISSDSRYVVRVPVLKALKK
jgi:sensor histidine kinase YesM